MGGLARGLVFACAIFSGAVFAQTADLVINHADSPDPGPAGGTFTYTVRVDNNGPSQADAVTLANTIPAGSSFVSVNTTAGVCNAPAGGVINCTLGNIPFNANQTVTVRVILPTAGVWTNRATAASATADPNPGNNVNNIQDTTAVQAADLALAAVPSAANVAAGEAYSYGLTASNLGPNAVDGAQTIVFTVPAGAAITGVPTGAGWSCAPGGGYPRTSGSITCTRAASLAAGASAAVLTVPAVANVSGTITGAFAVAGFKADNSPMPDGDTANNTVTADITASAGSDVSISKVANASSVALGDNVQYTLTPRLNGGELLNGQAITVTDTLGAGLTFVSAAGTGWTCDATISCTRPGYTGANFTDMPAITVTATAIAAGTLSNSADIATGIADPVPGNNSSAVNVTATNAADMQLSKFASPNPVVPGQNFRYTLRASNLGPLAVPGGQVITVTDNVPAGVTLSSLNSATGWTCDALPVSGPATWSCTRSTALGANANAPDIVVNANMPLAGNATNNACVSLDASARVDPSNGNDCTGVGVLASGTQADLRAVSKTAAPMSVVAGQTLTYVITVQNNGPASSTNVQLNDTLGSLITSGGFVSAVPSQGSCTPNSTTNGPSVSLSCALGTLTPAASATVTVQVRPSVATTGYRANTASVTSLDIGDPDQTNNSASVTSTVTAIVDITAAKNASPSPVRAGAPITFVATIGNAGPSTAQTVQMVDTLPSNAAFIAVDAVSGGGSCTPIAAGTVGGTLNCSWASINAGTQQTVTYRMRPLGNTAGGTVVNSIAATTATAESRTDNNSATTTTPVIAPQLDVLINKVDSADPVDLGQSTTYTITLNNSGPSYATNVVMTDVFPAPGSTPSATFSYQGALTVNAGGSCTQPAIGVTAGTLQCTFAGLASGQSATITYVMRAEALTVTGATTGTAFNRASVSVDETETTLANNVVTHDTTARRFAVVTDLALTKVNAATSVSPGGTTTYTLTATNLGPLPSDGAQLNDTLPAGTEFVSAPGCVNVASTVSCNIGPLAAGANRVFTLTLRLLNPYAGASPLVNTASIDAPGDPNPANNTASATTPVAVPPQITGVPTLSEWGVILLSALLALFGLRHLRLQRRH